MSYYYGNGTGNLGLYGALVSYGSANLTETSPPQSFTEPLTLAEVKSYLKIPVRSPVDPDEDSVLAQLITAAREQGEIAQNKDLVRKQIDLSFDYWPSYRVELGAPLVSVDLVQYTDSAGVVHPMVLNTDYIVDTAKRPGILSPPYNGTWPTFTPWPSSAILVRFTSGYSNTSAWWANAGSSVRVGMKLLISNWYNNRLPFDKGADAIDGYPSVLRNCLTAGAIPRAR